MTEPEAAADAVQTVSMRELTQRTADVVTAISQGGKPVLLSKHGHFVALITPIDDLVARTLLSSTAIRPLTLPPQTR